MNSRTATRVALLFFLLPGIAWAVLNRDDFGAEALQHWVQRFGLAGPFVFVTAYVIAAVFFYLVRYSFQFAELCAWTHADKVHSLCRRKLSVHAAWCGRVQLSWLYRT